MSRCKLKTKVSFILIFMLVASLLFLPASLVSAAPKSKTTTSVSYVALGDSIATGTVTQFTTITSYVTYFYQHLQSYYGRRVTVKLTNLSHDGDRTNELLLKLQTDSTVRSAVTNANVITISIGGNNLMQAASIPGFTSIDPAKLDQGLRDFNDQWPQIINAIKALNRKNAKIIVATVYNPYDINEPVGYEADQGLHELTDRYLIGSQPLDGQPSYNSIDNVINSNTALGYKVADTFTSFDAYSPSQMGQVTYMYPSLLNYIFRNPHPNSTGQGIITGLHNKVFDSY